MTHHQHVECAESAPVILMIHFVFESTSFAVFTFFMKSISFPTSPSVCLSVCLLGESSIYPTLDPCYFTLYLYYQVIMEDN